MNLNQIQADNAVMSWRFWQKYSILLVVDLDAFFLENVGHNKKMHPDKLEMI